MNKFERQGAIAEKNLERVDSILRKYQWKRRQYRRFDTLNAYREEMLSTLEDVAPNRLERYWADRFDG